MNIRLITPLFSALILTGITACAPQKTTSTTSSKKTATQSTQKKPAKAVTPVADQKKTPSSVKKPVGDYFLTNIGDITKNDNTISYGSIVSAKPRAYVISKEYFPSVAQNFRQKHIILHYTAIDDEKSILALTQRGVSSHYLVTTYTDNKILQLVDENKRAYHAGVSAWRGEANINDTSIGIEIVNMGNADGEFQEFPEHQIRKVAALVKDLVERYNIKPQNVLAHSDIAPTRKPDPGPKFPWKRLYTEYNVGMWYDEADKAQFISEFTLPGDWEQKMNDPAFIMRVQLDLQNFGYDIPSSGRWDETTRKTIQAFQYHFRPEIYDGKLDLETYSILKALMKKYPR